MIYVKSLYRTDIKNFLLNRYNETTIELQNKTKNSPTQLRYKQDFPTPQRNKIIIKSIKTKAKKNNFKTISMSKLNPLLIVSSLQPQSFPQPHTISIMQSTNDNQLQMESEHISQIPIYRRKRAEVKFTIKTIQDCNKYRVVYGEQECGDEGGKVEGLRNWGRGSGGKKGFFSGDRLGNNFLDLVFSTIGPVQNKQSRQMSRQRVRQSRYNYQLRKLEDRSEYIRKSLLQPCHIKTVNLSQRNKTTLGNKLPLREMTATRFKSLKSRRDLSKRKAQTLEPWSSVTIEEQQQYF